MRGRVFGWVILAMLMGSAVLVSTAGALAQAAASSQAPTVEERLDRLEQEFKFLETRLEAALDKLSAAAAPAVAAEASAQPVAASEGISPNAFLKQELEALQQKVLIDERRSELEQENVLEKAKAEPLVGAQAGRNGFFIKSADDAFRLNFGGLVQADARFFENGSPQPGASTFLPYKIRPIIDATFYKNFGLRIMPDFGNGTTVLQEAYLTARVQPWLTLTAGKYKGPVGLERLVTDSDVEFYERALPTNLVPNRDVGVQLSGDLWGGVLNYAAGIFNGGADGASADLDADNRREFEGRFFAQPFRKTSVKALQGFGAGLAGTHGDEKGSTSSPEVAAYKTSSQSTFFRYRSDGTAAGTAVANGEHYRISPQLYYYWGPLGLWSEYVLSSQQVSRSSVRGTMDNTAWQAAASYVLTGEKASYRGVTAAHSFDWGKGAWGAFEIAARFSELRVDREAFPVFADSANSAGGAKAWALGLNWYVNRDLKLVFNYEQTEFMQLAGGQKRKTEEALLERFQIAF